MRLLGNLYIKEAPLDTWNSKDEGWLEHYSKIVFNVNLEKNRLHAATILLGEEDIEALFHELEHYDIVKACLSIEIQLSDYFKASKEFHNRMTSYYL